MYRPPYPIGKVYITTKVFTGQARPGGNNPLRELTLVLNPEDSRLTWNRQEVDLAMRLGSR